MPKGPQNATYKEKQRFDYEIVVCLCQVRLGHGQGLTASACWRMAGFCIICWAWAIMFGSDIIFCALHTHTQHHTQQLGSASVNQAQGPGSRHAGQGRSSRSSRHSLQDFHACSWHGPRWTMKLWCVHVHEGRVLHEAAQPAHPP